MNIDITGCVKEAVSSMPHANLLLHDNCVPSGLIDLLHLIGFAAVSL